MGKFDNLAKFLGKEDSYPPEQIESGLDAPPPPSLDDLSDVTSDSLNNVDSLLSMFGSAPEKPKAAVKEESYEYEAEPEIPQNEEPSAEINQNSVDDLLSMLDGGPKPTPSQPSVSVAPQESYEEAPKESYTADNLSELLPEATADESGEDYSFQPDGSQFTEDDLSSILSEAASMPSEETTQEPALEDYAMEETPTESYTADNISELLPESTADESGEDFSFQPEESQFTEDDLSSILSEAASMPSEETTQEPTLEDFAMEETPTESYTADNLSELLPEATADESGEDFSFQPEESQFTEDDMSSILSEAASMPSEETTQEPALEDFAMEEAPSEEPSASIFDSFAMEEETPELPEKTAEDDFSSFFGEQAMEESPAEEDKPRKESFFSGEAPKESKVASAFVDNDLDTTGIDESVVKELANLDTPAPDIEELYRKFEAQSKQNLPDELMEEPLDSEEAAPTQTEDEWEFEVEKPQSSPDEFGFESEPHEGEMGSFLQGMEKEGGDFGGIGEEFPSEIDANEVSRAQIPSAEDEFADFADFTEKPSQRGISKTEPDFSFSEPSFGETPAMDDFGAAPTMGSIPSSDDLLDQDKIFKIRTKINRIRDAKLRKKVRKAIIETVLPKDAMDKLMMMLLLNESETAIAEFLEPYLSDREIEAEVEAIQAEREARLEKMKVSRKTIVAEEAKKSAQMQKDMQNFAKQAVILFAGVALIVIIVMNFIIRPMGSDKLYREGTNAINIGNYTLSEQKFKAAKDIGGNDLKWYNIYAQLYTTNKKIDLAKKKYEEAMAIDPYDRETVYNFADFHKMTYNPNKYIEAVKLYKIFASKNDKEFEIQDKIGTTYIEWAMDKSLVNTDQQRAEKLKEASDIYINFINKDNKHIPSYFRLLDIALIKKDATSIDELYTAIDKLDPKAVNIKTMTELGKYYVDLRKLDNAKPVFEKLMNTPNLKYDESFYQYGRYLTLNHDYAKAINALNFGLTNNISNAYIYNLLGEIYYINDSYPDHIEKARANFENSVNFNPQYFKPYVNLGHIYFYDHLSSFDSYASEDINRQNSEINLKKAFEYYKLGRRLIPKDTKDFDLSYNLSWLYYRYGDYTNSQYEIADLYVDEPYNPALSYAIANVYFQLDNLKLAKLQYDKTIEYYEAIAAKVAYINPELERHKEIYTQLARSYNNRGVVYATWAKTASKAQIAENEQKALLDFYKSKEIANKINLVPYNYSEFNINYILNRISRVPFNNMDEASVASIREASRERKPAFDNNIPKKTTLMSLVEEFKKKFSEKI